ncbi:hypothetical protein [Streptomyces sp. NPDC048282]|uniref:hypothetical protein n=1 Tax=Streptomyces sp. NPDC048282 TaxID=3365528 RepID=UPI00371647E8
MTMAMAMACFASRQAIAFNQILAASVVPVVILYLLLQCPIISGISQGATK